MTRWSAESSDDYYDANRWPRPANDDGPRTIPTSAERALRRDAEIARNLALGYPRTPLSIVPPVKKDIA